MPWDKAGYDLQTRKKNTEQRFSRAKEPLRQGKHHKGIIKGHSLIKIRSGGVYALRMIPRKRNK